MKNPLRLIGEKNLKLIGGGVLLLTLISVAFIVLTVSSRNRTLRQAEVERFRREQQAMSSSTDFGMEDFYLHSRPPGDTVVYPARQRKRIWSREDVDRYWIDPSEAGLQELSETNDALILDSLGVAE